MPSTSILFRMFKSIGKCGCRQCECIERIYSAYIVHVNTHVVDICTCINMYIWCVGSGFPSFLLFLYNLTTLAMYIVYYTHVFSCIQCTVN